MLTGVESLTPSELRVARMAAEGMENKEIAQALFVTAKTVETHLGHVYQKLDISSRKELPAALELGGSPTATPFAEALPPIAGQPFMIVAPGLG